MGFSRCMTTIAIVRIEEKRGVSFIFTVFFGIFKMFFCSKNEKQQLFLTLILRKLGIFVLFEEQEGISLYFNCEFMLKYCCELYVVIEE